MTSLASMSLARALHDCWRGRGLASSASFYRTTGPIARACATTAVLAGLPGLVTALWIARSPATDGEAWRIVFVHVPAAWLSLAIYLALAACSALTLTGRARWASVLGQALVPSGALMCLLTIWTGSLWGRPTSGAWWTWDARLAAEIGLLATYACCLVLPWFVDEPRRAERATAIFALGGVVNVLLVHSSLHWWQAVPVEGLAMAQHAPAATPATVLAFALMTLALGAGSLALVLQRARIIQLERGRRSAWAQAVGAAQS